ncbi:MAG: alpha-L-fucosidase, partial [Bacteroidota bacterium]
MRPYLLISLLFLLACEPTATPVEPPQPLGPLPSESQVRWHDTQYYMFVHFNMNTFTNMEWGTGGESPELFDPSDLDPRQWARIAKEAGMKGIILTAKHHDGFCLW